MPDVQLDSYSAVQSTKRMKDRFSDILSLNIIEESILNSYDSQKYKNVWNHRTKYYKAKAPHLLQLKERELEAKLDRRGIIFSISGANNTLASLRLIKRPFEIEGYDHNNINFNQYNNYWEIGRLVTTPELDHISLAIVVQYLLCVAGLEMFSSKKCQGLVGICKPENIKFFSKFGMQPGDEIYCSNRDIKYTMLESNIKNILDSTAKIIKYENRIHNRLSYLIG